MMKILPFEGEALEEYIHTGEKINNAFKKCPYILEDKI